MGGQGAIDKKERHRGTTRPYPGATQGHSLPPDPSPIPMEDWAHGYHGCVSLSPLQDSLRGPSS